MAFVGNVIWLLVAGWWLALGYLIAALGQFITIIGIPFGVQSLKLAGFSLWPFGRVVIERTDSNRTIGLLGNILWFLFGGVWLALGHLLAALLLAITIIGIPFAIANLKLARLALFPFGVSIVDKDDVGTAPVLIEI